MSDLPSTDRDRHNQRVLDELCRLLRFSQGEFELILAVCNSSHQRQGLVQQLRQQCTVPFAEITLDPSTTTLFTTIRSHIGDPPPAALMVYGLDGVQDLHQLLTATNQIREEFRQFPFPLVLWLTDDGLRQLIRTASDFYTWANAVTFATPPEFFLAFLDEVIHDVWQQVVASRENRFLSNQELGITPGSARCRELETSLNSLAAQGMTLTPEQAAGLAFVQGRIADNNTPAAREHYEHSLAQWQALVDQNPSAGAITPWQENIGHGQFYLGLWWRNYSVRHRREFGAACQQACDYFDQAVHTFETLQRPDLAARYINHWAEALHRLADWDALEAVATKALGLHQAQANPIRQARAEGFLAEVALAKDDWPTAQTHAQTALTLITPSPHHPITPSPPTSPEDLAFYAWVNSFHRSWYGFSLGKAQMGQGQVDAAVQTLEQVPTITQPEYDPLLYSQTLEYLRQGYFAQGHYLQAFETRREKEAIESRFNFRAFVGAGRLQPKQQVTNPALPTGDHDPDLIMASGRKRDVQRLVTRLEQDAFVLTIIYGPSGVGKSSLIEAGLVPTLEQQRFGGRRVVPVRLRSYGTWAEDLLAALPSSEGPGVGQILDAGDLPTPPSGHPSEEGRGDDFPRLGGARGGSAQSLPTPPALAAQPEHPSEEGRVLDRLRQQTQRNRAMVLIFDQFEEFFFACDQPADRLRFYSFLCDCLGTPYVKVILSLREDYTHYLLECNRLTDLAIIDNNILDKKWLYYLGNFSPEDAKGVINDLTQPTPYAPAPDLVERVVADLAAGVGEVRPIELQIVGSQLQAEAIATLADYQGWPHRETSIKAALVQQYLNDVVQDCGPEGHQQLANLVLYLLTDDKGTRPRKTRSELANELQALTAQGSVDATPFGLVLQVLTESGLVVHLPEVPEERYQLVHDYLAAFIHQQQQPQLEALMAQLEDEKRQRRQLEQQKAELAESNQALGANLALMRAEQDDLQQKNRRARRVLAGTVVAAAAVAALAGGTAITSTLQARSAKAQAIEAQGDATQKEREADLNVTRATYQVGMATLREGVADRRAIQREAEAQQEVEAALAELSDIDQRAKQEQQAAQAAIQTAEAQVAAAKVAGAQAQADLAAAREARANALAEQERARYEAALIRRVTNLERAGVTASQKFESQETEALLATFKYAKEAYEITNTEGLSYLASSPLLALQTILNNIRETRLAGRHGLSRQVEFSPDGSQIATIGPNGTVQLWDAAGNQVALLEGHQGYIDQVTFSPDGTQIATSADGTARLWDLQGNQLAVMKSHQRSANQLVFSPDGTQIATSGENGTVKLWDLAGNQIALLEGHEGYVNQVTFSPDGTQIVTTGSDHIARLWDLAGNHVALMDDVSQVVFSPDGIQLATTGSNGARLWDLAGHQVLVMKGHRGVVYEVVFSPNGTQIATRGEEDTVRLWDLQGNQLAVMERHEGIHQIVFSPNGMQIATSGADGTARLWDLQSNQVAVMEGHQGNVYEVVFNPNGMHISTNGEDGTVRLWDLHGNQLAVMEGHQSPVRWMAFSPNGTQIATSGEDGTVRLWGLTGNQLAVMENNQGYIDQVAFSPDGTQVATTGFNGTARLWDLQGNQLAVIEDVQGAIRELVFSPDGTQIATTESNGTARLRDLQGNQLAVIEDVQGAVRKVVFSPDGSQIATAGEDGTVRLWNLQGNQLAVMEGHEKFLYEVVFSPDGTRIATTGSNGTARLWDLQGNQLAVIKDNQGEIVQVVFSPDGARIATTGSDGTARLWDLQGNQLAVIKDNQGYVSQVVFSPDSARIATAGSNGTAQLSDLQGNQLALMEGHQSNVWQVVFSPDGTQIATTGFDGTSRIWALNGQQIAQYEGYGTLRDDWQYIAVRLPPDRLRGNGVVKLWPVYTLDRIDELLAAACQRLTPYLTYNPDISNEDRALCGIPPREGE